MRRFRSTAISPRRDRLRRSKVTDTHYFAIDSFGNLFVENTNLETSKSIPGKPAGSVANPSDVAALACQADKELIRLWRMILPVAKARGWNLTATHLVTPEPMLSLREAVTSINLNTTLPGSSEQSVVSLGLRFDLSSEKNDGKRSELVDQVDAFGERISEFCEAEVMDDWEFGDDPEAVARVMNLHVVVESPGHAEELMSQAETLLHESGLANFWEKSK